MNECNHKGNVIKVITSDPLNPTFKCLKCGREEKGFDYRDIQIIGENESKGDKHLKTIVSQKVMDVIRKKANESDEKGIKEYGQSLDEVPFTDYDWNVMALEEVLDALKYQLVENTRIRVKLREKDREIKGLIEKYERLYVHCFEEMKK